MAHMIQTMVQEHLSESVQDEYRLHILEEAHAADLFKLVDHNRAHLRKWLPWVDGTKNVDDSLAFIRMSLDECVQDKALHLGIWKADQLIGIIGFHVFDWKNKKTSLGYWLDESHQGSGAMTACCRTLVDFAFNALSVNRVEIRCAVKNARSITIAERLGFIREGIARQAEWLYDHFVDHVVYSMLLSDWRSGKTLTQNCP
jgi:ribosomal-protein-serine acetyltransferase